MGKTVSENTNYSIYGHTFFGYTSAIFWPIGLNFLWREININTFILEFRFLGVFWRENGRGRHAGAFRFWAQKSAKKLAHAGVHSGHKLPQNLLPKIVDPGSPLKAI